MNKDLKKELDAAFSEDVPFVLDDIMARLDDTVQLEQEPKTVPVKEKRVYIKPERNFFGFMKNFAYITLMTVGVLMGGFLAMDGGTAVPVSATNVYIDVNPSVELALDENACVIATDALNEDGRTVLDGIDVNKTSFGTAIKTVIGKMYMNGYITDDSTSILLSVEGNVKESFMQNMVDEVNEIFVKTGKRCAIIAQKIAPSDETVENARKNGVSVGKFSLVDKIIKSNAYSEFNDVGESNCDEISSLCGMPIKDLSLMYSTYVSTESVPTEDVVSKPDGFCFGYCGEKVALMNVLAKAGKTKEDVATSYISAQVEFIDGQPIMYYYVQVRYKTNRNLYVYKVCALDGSVV